MIRLMLSVLSITVLVTACSREPQPVELQVGEHRISVVVPEGWEHIDYGERHQLHRELERISIEAFPRPNGDLDANVDIRLVELKEDRRRDTATRERFDLAGHEALTVDTWDKLSHQYRKRFVFVAVDNSLMAIHTMQGRFEDLVADFDALISSFTVVDTLHRAVGDGDDPE
jgi:hypothetical protein